MDSSNRPSQTPRRRRVLRLLTGLVVLLSIGVFALIFRQFGGEAISESLHALGSTWTTLLLLEMGRIACELAATRSALGPDAAKLSRSRFVRGQLLAQMLELEELSVADGE